MRFTPQFLDEIRARIPVSHVVSRKVALKKAGREFKGLSPFKQERTPSFFVNDHKGFYKCFASGEHGDIFTFLMKTEGLEFPEAVERLASEAGLQMPAPERREPGEAQRVDERTRLLAAMQAAQDYFRDRLESGQGREARAYIERRGLTRETVDRFGLGFAPAGRSALKDHLTARGFTVAELATAGLLIAGEDIPVPYDRFRNRVMFPIADLKGRIVAFGGRALDPDAPAKYLNSPETPLFHKGALLFNSHNARQPAFDHKRIVVVEGYMDVIALAQAGIAEAVAPLGTALTETQIQLLWRLSPEPLLCFDGDSAGRKAAFRAVETVVGLLKPGHSLRFAFLPDGLDPDDLVRQQGRDAAEAVLDRARPLFEVLWEREQAGHDLTTPEQRAAFEQRLKGLVGRIGDPTVRQHYEQQLRQTLWSWSRDAVRDLTAPKRTSGGRTAGRSGTAADWRAIERGRLKPHGKAIGPRSAISTPAGGVSPPSLIAGRSLAFPTREALMIRALLNHPWLIDDHAEQIAMLEWTAPALAELRDAVLTVHAETNSLDRTALLTHLTSQGFAKVVALVERAITHKGDKFAEPEADPAAVETGWRDAVALHERHVGLRRALASALASWQESGDEQAFARICEIRSLINRSDGVEAAAEDDGGATNLRTSG